MWTRRPASCGNWRAEIRRFLGEEAHIIDGFPESRARIPPNVRWVIVNPDVLQGRSGRQGWVGHLTEWAPSFIVADESHAYKSRTSGRSEALTDLAHGVSCDATLMSGTPQSNGPMDLWSQLNILEPGMWGTWFEWGLAFCSGIERKRFFGKGRYQKFWDMSGVSNAEVLNRRLRYIMIRRTREDIGNQIPPQTRIRQVMDLLPGFRLQYDQTMKEYRQFVEGLKAPKSEDEEDARTMAGRMQFVLKLRQISSKGRIDGTVDFTANLVEQGKRPVVFAYFTDTLHGIRSGLEAKGLKVGFIDGSVNRQKRDDVRELFTAKKLDVLVGQTEAMGVGINLQDVSDMTVMHDLSYRPLDIIQCEGRVARSGQKNPTFHYYCLGEDTKDGRILEIVLDKMAGNKAVLDADVLKAIEADFFQESRKLKGEGSKQPRLSA